MTPPGDLKPRQWGMLLVVAHAHRPGHVAPGTERTLLALETRGLVESRPDPIRQAAGWMYIWTATEAGRALVAAARAEAKAVPPQARRGRGREIAPA